MVPEDTVPVTSQGPELETTGASDKVGLRDSQERFWNMGWRQGGEQGTRQPGEPLPAHPRPSQGFSASTLCSSAEL